MSEHRRFLANFFSLTGARILMRAAGAVSSLIIARYLGADLYGVYATAFSFVSLGVVFADIGVAQVVVRAGSRRDPQLGAVFGNALAIKVLCIGLVYGGLLVISRVLGHGEQLSTTIKVLGVGLLLVSGHRIPFALFQSAERMHVNAAFEAGTALLVLAGVITATALDGGILALAAVQVAAGLLPLPVLLGVAGRQTRPRPRLRQIPGMLREGLSFGLGGIFYFINAQIDVVILGSLATSAAVGVYAAPYRLVQTLYFIPSIVSGVILPRLFRSGHEDPAEHRETSRHVLRYLSLFGLLCSGLMFLCAEPLILLLLGEAYAGSAPLLRLLAWFLPLQCVSYPLGDALTTANHNNLRVLIVGAAATFNLIANLLLIPIWGPYAAAVTTLASESIMAIGYAIAVVRLIPGFSVLRSLLPQLLASAAGLLAAMLLLGGTWATTWSVAVPAAVLFTGSSVVLLFPFRFVQAPERRMLRALVGR